MYNNIFQQAAPANNTFNGMNNMMGNFGGGMNTAFSGFPQNNGLNFGNVAPAKTSTTSAEEMALIKSQKSGNFTMSEEEIAKAGWDLREGRDFALEVVDPSTELLREKYTGVQFHLMSAPVEALRALLEPVKWFAKTMAITNTTDNPDTIKEVLTAVGIVDKLLPIGYENGQKNYNTLINQLQNMISPNGYQGNWGNSNPFNGMIGSTPNYIINDSMTGMMGNNMNNNINYQNIMQMMQASYQNGVAAANQQMQNQMAQMMQNNNAAINVNGGTMLGGGVGMNAFTQGGAPQVTPQSPTPTMGGNFNMQNIPIPQPNSPTVTQNTANPSMGSTTASATV